MFKGSGSYVDAESNIVDVIICDDYAIIGLTRESPEIKAFAA